MSSSISKRQQLTTQRRDRKFPDIQETVVFDAGRRTTLTDALSHVTTFAYDNSGNQISVKDARQNTTQYQYDTLNRQTAVIYRDQSSSSTAYDNLGRVVSKTDQAGKVTAYGYDALGRLTSVTQDAVTGGLNLVTQYGYDEVGNRISQTDANSHTTTYAYDQLGRRTSRTLPAGQSESYVYDAGGNLKTKTDFNGKTTTYAYDTSNRLLSKTPDASFNAPAVSFTYFANGLRETMSDVSGTTTYGYDTRNRLTSKQTPFGTLAYSYDSAGNLLTLGSSNTNGASLTYAYDALNRLATVTDNRLLSQGATSGLTTYNYDAVGNLQNFTYPNGVVSAYTYDNLNRLTQMGSSKTSALSNYVYTLGAAGNRTSVAELSGRTVAYGYDSLYRLMSETVNADQSNKNGAINYTYDAVGNRKTLNATLPPAGGISYTYDADDRLGSDQYDPGGNTTLSGGISNAYDFENHMVTHGGVTVGYDGDGNRVSETVSGVTTTYLVDTVNPTGYAQVVDELQSATVSRTYAYGLERISENQILSSTWTPSFYGYDGHGSVRQLTNAAGAVTDTYDYDAFGNLINSTGSTPNNYLFAGEQFDPALGLYYNRARYLNTATGRFWSMDEYEGNEQDPISLHKYLYANADPINETDSTGHEPDIATTEGAIAIDEQLEATLANIENATELIAKQEAAAKIVVGTLAAAALLLAADFIYENKTRGDDGKPRRGRIGIQGNDLARQAKRFANSVSTIRNQLDTGTGGGTVSFSRDTLAWGWSRTWPVLKVEGTSAVDAMVGQLGQNQVACRKSAIEKAKATINSGPLPQGYSKDFPGENYSFCDGSERVDIQVYVGTAFEK